MSSKYDDGRSGRGHDGDPTDFDYQRGVADRARSAGAIGGVKNDDGRSSPDVPPGAGVFFLYMIVPAAILAASIVAGVLIAATVLMALGLLAPAKERLTFEAYLGLAVRGVGSILLGGLAIGMAIAVLSTNLLAGQVWLTMPVVSEFSALAQSMPLVWATAGGWLSSTMDHAFIMPDIFSQVVGKTVIYGPGVLLFARFQNQRQADWPLPKGLRFIVAIALSIVVAMIAVPAGNWVTGEAMRTFSFAGDRFGSMSFPVWALLPFAALAVGVFFLGGLIAGPIQLWLARLYNPQLRTSHGYVGAAFRSGLFYALAGAFTIALMLYWPFADGLVITILQSLYTINPINVPGFDGSLTSAMLGYMLMAAPSIFAIAGLLHLDGLMRKEKLYDYPLALIVAALPMAILGPLALLAVLRPFGV